MKKIVAVLLLILSAPVFGQSIEFSLSEHRAEFPADQGGEVSGRINNKTNDPLKIVFRRWQTLPTGWTSTICLDVCYSSVVDSLPWGDVEYSVIEPHAFIPFVVHFYPTEKSNDSAVAYVKISVLASTEDDTIGVTVIGKSNATSSVKVSEALGFSVKNYPNPAIKSTTITYSLTERTPVTLVVRDVLGREVSRLIAGETQDAGTYDADLDVSKLATGSYFYTLTAGEKSITRTLNVTK